jgi:hypothetical protein
MLKVFTGISKLFQNNNKLIKRRRAFLKVINEVAAHRLEVD